MAQESLLDLVQQRLDEYCSEQRAKLEEISPEILELVGFAQDLLTGGKRLRAQFCYWSWAGYALARISEQQLESQTRGIIGIAAALEMFHGAALVHDDLLDQSDTRRGMLAVHRRFEQLHGENGFAGDPERFGVAGSVLVGDLMLAWSSELFGLAVASAVDAERENRCRDEFSQMRFEVMAGQYLDILEENAAPLRSAQEMLLRANRVMLYKTAKYSLEAPLLIGAAFGGANSDELHALSSFGIPLGMAFQLRDDLLGVFGDPAVTGKPAGDDLREGKRTVLIGLTLELLQPSVAKIFGELLGQPDLAPEQLEFLQQAIVDSGARDRAESMIEEYSRQALDTLESIRMDSHAKQQLSALATAAINRKF